ncbi:hypothetical protein DOTSEDRAFT_39610 [Dothistroma septosporum NZE10]|uniref:Uncharacterized protein n=1 Tax=Dothistroma septosporum (strain NZE10 / CBS 128990) TaxID=675120 RepID=M2XZE8_DOTSN|nr:hypothetical protein DOTSEDRAFT_39610 [Dothistroma septosporum NZE10]
MKQTSKNSSTEDKKRMRYASRIQSEVVNCSGGEVGGVRRTRDSSIRSLVRRKRGSSLKNEEVIGASARLRCERTYQEESSTMPNLQRLTTLVAPLGARTDTLEESLSLPPISIHNLPFKTHGPVCLAYVVVKQSQNEPRHYYGSRDEPSRPDE